MERVCQDFFKDGLVFLTDLSNCEHMEVDFCSLETAVIKFRLNDKTTSVVSMSSVS
jgi:hypothetical protein